MAIEIWVSLIGAVATIASVVITTRKSNAKLTNDFATELKVARAVTDTKIEELTREVREHNNFARRMPVVEEQIKVINHRIGDLERMRE